MVRWVLIVGIAFFPGITIAQLDDLIDGPWAAPALDVLERRREEPLCLVCCNAYDLTEIPGISQRTARAIVRSVDAGGITSISSLCDTLCLTPDQFILLTSCTTLQCSCGGLIRSASARIRMPTASTDMGLIRMDIDHAIGRAGILYAQPLDAAPSITGAWATATIGNNYLAIGDVALRMATGLIMGTSSGLTRSPAEMLRSTDGTFSMRPWTSTSQEGSLRGLALHTPIPSLRTEFTGLMGRSVDDGVATTTYACSFSHVLPTGNVSLSAVSTLHSSYASLSAEQTIGNTMIRGELAFDDNLRWSGHLHGEYNTSQANIGFSLWRYSPDIKPPFGTSSGTSSAPYNHAGMLIYVRTSPWRTSTLLGSISYGGRLSRSHLNPLPTSSLDITTDLQTRPWRGVSISARLRYERSADAISIDDVRRMDVSSFLMGRIDVDVPLTRTVQGRIRCDLRNVSWRSRPLVDHGTLLFLDVRWHPQPDITLRGRWTQFSSTSGTIAPRMLDATVVGALQTVVANGKGARWTIAVRWQVAPWIAVSGAYHDDRRVVDGAVRTDRSALFQIDLRLRAVGRREFIAIDDESSTRLE